MRLTSPHFQPKLYPTAVHVRRGFRVVARAGAGDPNPFLILDDVSDFCQGYVQAILQSTGWWVEFRPMAGERHYRLPAAVSERDAAAVFENFLRVGAGVLEQYPWSDVSAEIERALDEARRRSEEPGTD